MVGGRLLLLSIAVLSSLGVDHVFGGQLTTANRQCQEMIFFFVVVVELTVGNRSASASKWGP